jgi:hypothetical protein
MQCVAEYYALINRKTDYWKVPPNCGYLQGIRKYEHCPDLFLQYDHVELKNQKR